MRRGVALGLAGGLAIGVLLALAIRPGVEQRAKSNDIPRTVGAAARQAPPLVVVPPAELSQDSINALRQVVRDEVTASKEVTAPSVPADAGSNTPEVVARLSAPELDAYSAGRDVVTRAIAAGSFNKDDYLALRESLMHLPAAAQIEVAAPLVQAANLGKVRFESHFKIFP